MTWGDLYKQFCQEFPMAKATEYRPFADWYLPEDRYGIIVWLENGDIFAYFPKSEEPEGE